MPDDKAASNQVGSMSEKAKWPLILAVVLTAILEVLDSTIVNVALPHMKAAFGITSDQTTWILTSYIVASVIVMPLTGLFSKMFGRRRLIVTAISGFALFSALSGVAWSIESIVIFRIGQGVFGAFLIPLSQSILFDSFPKEKRGQAMAIFGLGVVVAPILGPTLGAVLTEYFSWRAVFYVNIPIAAFALFMMSGELKKEDTHSVNIDWVGLFFMVAAIGALQIMLDQGESKDWFASKYILVAAVISLVGFMLFIYHGMHNKDSIIDFSLLRDKSFACANMAMLGFGLAMYGAIAILPLLVQGLLDYPVLEAGYLFVPRGIAAGFSMVFTGIVLAPRFDQRGLAICGLLLTGLGNMWMGDVNTQVNFWNLAWPGILSGLGMGLFFVPMSTLAFQNISQDKQDEASGIYGVMRSLGSSLGIAIVGWQLVSRTQFHWSTLSAKITATNQNAIQYLAPLDVDLQSPLGLSLLADEVSTQAQMLAFQDVFLLTAWAAFLMIPLMMLINKPDQRIKTA